MRRMPSIVIVFLLIVLSAASSHPAEKGGFQFRKQPELQQIKPKKPVKIKLRRTAKGEYSWELSGDDADEIVRTDRKLKKMLNIK
jgi:hypothetical protein